MARGRVAPTCLSFICSNRSPDDLNIVYLLREVPRYNNITKVNAGLIVDPTFVSSEMAKSQFPAKISHLEVLPPQGHQDAWWEGG